MQTNRVKSTPDSVAPNGVRETVMEVGSGITEARDVVAGQLLYATAKFIVDHNGVKGVIRSCLHFRSNKLVLKRVGIDWSEDAGDAFDFREVVDSVERGSS